MARLTFRHGSIIISELMDWCEEHIGSRMDHWFLFDGGGDPQTFVLNIKDEQKAMLARIKWSESLL